MISRLLFISGLLLLQNLTAVSQEMVKEKEAKERTFTASGTVDIGYANLSTGSLQTFLPAGDQSLSTNFIMLGASGYLAFGKIILGVSGYKIISKSTGNDSLRTKIDAGMGFFNLGYALIKKDKVMLFPVIGIGGVGLRMNISDKQDITAGQVAADPGQEITLRIRNVVFDFGLGIDFIPFLKYEKNGKEAGGFKIGIRAGYMLGLDKNNWAYSGGNVSEAPDFGVRSFYVRLVFGAHRFTKLEPKSILR